MNDLRVLIENYDAEASAMNPLKHTVHAQAVLWRVVSDLRALARRLRPQEPAGLIGTVERIGDDEGGQPRIVIHTTREAIKALPENLIGKMVTVGRPQVDDAMVERALRAQGWEIWREAAEEEMRKALTAALNPRQEGDSNG